MSCKNVNNYIYLLVSDGLATYTDIRYRLSIWDVLDLIEIFTVKHSNELIRQDYIKDNQQTRRG